MSQPPNDWGSEPLREPTRHQLSHRISNISDISDSDPSPYDATPDHALRGRESLVSLDSDREQRPTPQDELEQSNGDVATGESSTSFWKGALGYPGQARYTPVAGSTALQRGVSRSNRKSAYRNSLGGAIPEGDEEEYDLSLLRSAAPIASDRRYEAIAEEEQSLETPAVDLTATLGPSTTFDESFVRRLQEQEAQGNLTGGLGQGFRPDSTVRDEDLLNSPITRSGTLSKSFTRRGTKKRLTRDETIKSIGQDEANRRGEVIEVIVEEGPVDITTAEGPVAFASEENRASTFEARKQTTQMFFPQPNWKPFSMRWPYLAMLILLSTALAITQEALYRRYRKDPLLKFTNPGEVKPAVYFGIKFAPTLTAVVLGVLWQFTDFEVRRLEAYHQLSKNGGALAAESINVDYVSSFSFLRPVRALRLGHYAVALSSIATTLAISLIPTFAAASVVLSPSRQERMDHPDGVKEIHFNAVWSRLLTSTLAICAAIGIGLFYVLQTRRSGLLADVRGIAGLASMAVVSHILMDFKDLDTAKPNDIHHRLKYHRYMLRNSSLAPDNENPVTSQDRTRYETDYKVSENPHPLVLRPAGSIPFIISLLLFTGFVPIFLFTPANVITDKAAWVITAMAVGLKLAWTGMDTAVRMMEPFYILSRRHAPAKILTLDYTALPFGYMPVAALLNGHMLVFLVGFGSVAAEFLTILVTGLASSDGQDFFPDKGGGGSGGTDSHHSPDITHSGQETKRTFGISLALTLFTLVYMFVVSLVVFLRRRHAFLPRQPCTIASILAFIHQSKMLYKFVGTEKLSTAEVRAKLEDGTTYGLGWFEGRDGGTHCGVDREELHSGYKHGIDFSQGNKPWNQRWDQF